MERKRNAGMAFRMNRPIPDFASAPSGLRLRVCPRKSPGHRGRPGQNLLDGRGNWGMQSRPASDHQRAPARLVPGRLPSIDVAALQQGRRNARIRDITTLHHASDSGSKTMPPLGYFLPLDLAPFRRGFFLGKRGAVARMERSEIRDGAVHPKGHSRIPLPLQCGLLGVKATTRTGS